MASDWLLFVDTNIFLDFYRQGESATRLLGLLEKHKDKLITSDQTRMEFMKHRQRVIIENLKNLNKPTAVTIPPILQDYQPAKMLAKNTAEAVGQWKKIKRKIESVLANPSQNDPVYRVLSRIFDHTSEYILRRPNKDRFRIRALARKRFALGYPPRKSNDTSMGDAINWEWIICCATRTNYHILIVSRDEDYGVSSNGEAFLNDWLSREFKERISRKRKIELTNKLTIGLKRLDEQVSKDDEREEEALIGDSRNLRGDWSVLLDHDSMPPHLLQQLKDIL